MKKIFAVFLLMLAVSTLAAQDVYIKSKNHTDAISMGAQNQPARDMVTEQWIGAGKLAVVTPNKTTIVNVNKKLMYIVNHKTRTYVEAALPLDFAGLLPPESLPALQSARMTATVTPTGKKKIIGGRSCDEYNVALTVNIIQLNAKIYASTNVPFDVKSYSEKIAPSFIKSQMIGLDDASIQELGKIKGLTILSETTGEAMGAKIHQTTEVVQIIKKPAPAGIYSVPAGYTKQAKLSIQDLQNQ